MSELKVFSVTIVSPNNNCYLEHYLIVAFKKANIKTLIKEKLKIEKHLKFYGSIKTIPLKVNESKESIFLLSMSEHESYDNF